MSYLQNSSALLDTATNSDTGSRVLVDISGAQLLPHGLLVTMSCLTMGTSLVFLLIAVSHE